MDSAYGVILYNANQGGEMMYSLFRVAGQLQQDMILGFDWLQSVNP